MYRHQCIRGILSWLMAWSKCYISIKDRHISIQLNYQVSVVEDAICGDYVRVQSRKARASYCLHILKAGVDVCVLSNHPITESSDDEPQEPMLSWVDAKIMLIKRDLHEGRCACQFSVILDRNKVPTSFVNYTSDRVATEVVTVELPYFKSFMVNLMKMEFTTGLLPGIGQPLREANCLLELTGPDTTVEEDLGYQPVNYESDVEILYNYVNLRCSKRRKVIPERFTSYSEPNFNRGSTKKNDSNGLQPSTSMIASLLMDEQPLQIQHSVSRR